VDERGIEFDTASLGFARPSGLSSTYAFVFLNFPHTA